MTLAPQKPQRPAGAPRLAWASIATGARNYGNLLIEWSLRRILDLPEPAISFDSFAPMDDALARRINAECDLLLSPGCTTLQVGQNAAYLGFDRIRVPKPCFGGCLWQAARSGRLGMVLHALGTGARPPRSPVDLRIARMMSAPVGSRDPFTHEALRAGGIDSRLIGCPTLLIADPVEGWRKPAGRTAVFSLSRGALPRQWELVGRLRRRWKVTAFVHEPYERKVLGAFPGIERVQYESPDQYVRHYAQADLVVTGRLHGALPAIAHGTPVVFFGDPSDTRLSLLEHLGIPIRRPGADLAAIVHSPSSMGLTGRTFEVVAQLRRSFARYAGVWGIGTRMKC